MLIFLLLLQHLNNQKRYTYFHYSRRKITCISPWADVQLKRSDREPIQSLLWWKSMAIDRVKQVLHPDPPPKWVPLGTQPWSQCRILLRRFRFNCTILTSSSSSSSSKRCPNYVVVSYMNTVSLPQSGYTFSNLFLLLPQTCQCWPMSDMSKLT